MDHSSAWCQRKQLSGICKRTTRSYFHPWTKVSGGFDFSTCVFVEIYENNYSVMFNFLCCFVINYPKMFLKTGLK